METYLVTGGAGFIGSNFVLMLRNSGSARIINLDRLTYAGNLANLESLKDDVDHIFVQGDILDKEAVDSLLAEHQPSAIIHFAAESHVDRSIHAPEDFIQTNVVGTFRLLEAARGFWDGLIDEKKKNFRFLHVSTDEVYGSLGPDDPAFTENHAYSPNSPYSASKAASDHLVRAYYKTYSFPIVITNCSNNYGPFQFPEKLIPLMIMNAVEGKPLPIYGDGKNVRDWLYVEDHCRAILKVLETGKDGETYNIGGLSEKNNIEVVDKICSIMDELRPDSEHIPHGNLKTFVKDRPGHDQRYAIDNSKLRHELGWEPKETFEAGIRKTIKWYLDNEDWIKSVKSGEYRNWIKLHYGQDG